MIYFERIEQTYQNILKQGFIMKAILIVLLLLINLHAESFVSNKKQENASYYILSLKDLIIATQNTRGLTNSYLNGNKNLLRTIKKHQYEMQQAIERLETSPMVSDPTIEFYTVTISRELSLLNKKALKMDPDIAFLNYTDEISKLIEWAKIVSYRSKITNHSLGQDVTDLLTKVLLPMIEDIAQIRGIGSGVIVKGKINAENKEKILALRTDVGILKKELQSKMQKILSGYSSVYNNDMAKGVEYISNEIQQYMNITETILVISPDTIDSAQYFEKGTKIINMLIKLHKINHRAAAISLETY